MSTPNPTHIIPDNVIVLTKRAAFESVAGTGIYHSEDFREGVSLALDALAEVLTDAGYSIVGPSETHVDNGGIKRDSQTSEPYVCEGFAWVGQSFASCEECGRPYWEHSHDRRSGGSDGPFGLGLRLVPITPEQARGCRMKWDPSFTAAAAEGEKP